MGGMAEPWRSMRLERQNQVASGKRYSMQYRTEKEAIEGASWKNKLNFEDDEHTLKSLAKMGLEPVRKNTHSFQINVNGRVGMYYNGKKEKIIFNDGETIDLPYHNSLEEYIEKESA